MPIFNFNLHDQIKYKKRFVTNLCHFRFHCHITWHCKYLLHAVDFRIIIDILFYLSKTLKKLFRCVVDIYLHYDVFQIKSYHKMSYARISLKKIRNIIMIPDTLPFKVKVRLISVYIDLDFLCITRIRAMLQDLLNKIVLNNFVF